MNPRIQIGKKVRRHNGLRHHTYPGELYKQPDLTPNRKEIFGSVGSVASAVIAAIATGDLELAGAIAGGGIVHFGFAYLTRSRRRD